MSSRTISFQDQLPPTQNYAAGEEEKWINIIKDREGQKGLEVHVNKVDEVFHLTFFSQGKAIAHSKYDRETLKAVAIPNREIHIPAPPPYTEEVSLTVVDESEGTQLTQSDHSDDELEAAHSDQLSSSGEFATAESSSEEASTDQIQSIIDSTRRKLEKNDRLLQKWEDKRTAKKDALEGKRRTLRNEITQIESGGEYIKRSKIGNLFRLFFSQIPVINKLAGIVFMKNVPEAPSGHLVFGV